MYYRTLVPRKITMDASCNKIYVFVYITEIFIRTYKND